MTIRALIRFYWIRSMKTKDNKVDELVRAYAGSQLQIQIYVNRRSEELFQKVIRGLPDLALLHPLLNWEYLDNTSTSANNEIPT